MKPYYDGHGITIYHGDCREVVANLQDGIADLLLTDPPYSMDYKNKAGQSLRGDGTRLGIRIFRSALLDLDRLLANDTHVYVFCHWESWPDFYDAVGAYWRIRNALIWHKNAGGAGDCSGNYAWDYEVVLFAHKGRRLLQGRRDGAVRELLPVPGRRRDHPTQKPVDLLAYFIEKSSLPGETVLDPYMGSGSTLVAARMLGRRAIGVEIEERYCEIAARRVEECCPAEALEKA